MVSQEIWERQGAGQQLYQKNGSQEAIRILTRSRKTILPVHLHYPPSSKTPHCPSCARELSNSTASFLLSSRSPASASAKANGHDEPVPESGAGADADADGRPAKKAKKAKADKSKDKEAPYVCGHVVCKTCVDTIVRPAKRCCVCEAEVLEEGLIPVGKEGMSLLCLNYWGGAILCH
jgi:nitric oxide synthase-interacting protein